MLIPTHLVSDLIDCIAWESFRLYVRFKSGPTYSYKDVPYDYFDSLCKAESAGQWFHHNIKKNKAILFRKEPNDPFITA
jgi:hypothetical protein